MANDGTLYRVHTGDYIGLNFGKVIGIYEDRTEMNGTSSQQRRMLH